MTGLQKIIARIEADTDAICADIKSKADKECQDIIISAGNKAVEIAEKGRQEANARYEDLISRAKSTAELDVRTTILSAKQQCIREALENARRYILALDDCEYFALILQMAQMHSEELAGEIMFSYKDLSRIPQGFETELRNRVKGTLSIGKDSVNIDGGFVLVYGMVEVNCSFESIFAANSERFSDEVSAILFC